MKRIIIIIILIYTKTFSQVIVHSKNDKRLLSYYDSVKCYLFGLKQLNIAKRIKNREDSACGKKYYCFLEKYKRDNNINPKIKPISYEKRFYSTYYKGVPAQEIKQIGDDIHIITYSNDSIWYPDVFKKPKLVIYEPLIKHHKLIVKNDTTKKKTVILIYKLNGQTVSREQFEKFYGKKVSTEN